MSDGVDSLSHTRIWFQLALVSLPVFFKPGLFGVLQG